MENLVLRAIPTLGQYSPFDLPKALQFPLYSYQPWANGAFRGSQNFRLRKLDAPHQPADSCKVILYWHLCRICVS